MTTAEYEALLRSLEQGIRSAQLQALRSANREQIQLYMDIGRMIVERQEGDSWGHGIVATLAVDLQREFPNTSGFSSANLWRMKGFFGAYSSSPKLAQLVREIGWSHNIAIFERCKSDEEREFYLRSCRQHGWTRDVLLHQIENRNFHEHSRVNTTTTAEYEALLRSLKQRIRSAQLQALGSANREQIQLYMDIGRMIVER